jgi:hypothetical protein
LTGLLVDDRLRLAAWVAVDGVLLRERIHRAGIGVVLSYVDQSGVSHVEVGCVWHMTGFIRSLRTGVGV